MVENVDSGVREYRPCKPELRSPTTDWPLSWSICRQKGMPADLASFVWKMVMNLLCTQEKLFNMGSVQSPTCKLCTVETGTLKHELLECSFNNGVGHKLLVALQSFHPSLTPEGLLRLELGNSDQQYHLPSVLLIAIALKCVWVDRGNNSRVRTYQVRSELEQSINLLRTTRHINSAVVLNTMVEQMF